MPVAIDPSLDSTAAFLREGYTFISSRCEALGADGVRTRLLGRPVTCWRGPRAAARFYDGGSLTRKGAMPSSVLHLLQDKGSVQTLDGEAHRLRKRLFLDMMDDDALDRLGVLLRGAWADALPRWRAAGRIVFHAEMTEVLTRVACAWAGVPLAEAEVADRRRELAAMVHGAGRIGPAHWRARLLRRRCERWAADVIASTSPPLGTPLAALQVARLDRATQVVELLNVLRPIVAVSRFLTFAALALHQHPEWRRRLAEDDGLVRPFLQEVRRTTPFFPLVGGKVRYAFDFDGDRYRRGDWILLDLFGTNHHAATWPDPAIFRPERFIGVAVDPNTLIPQGAGDARDDHRCPGEAATERLMAEALRLLCADGLWRVPDDQDLRVPLTVMPTLPNSGLELAVW